MLLDENDHNVTLWEKFPEQVEALLRDRENKKFLPGIRVPEAIGVTGDIGEALDGADLVVFVVPTHAMRDVAKAAAASGKFGPETIAVNASKGIEEGSLKRMSEVLDEELPVDASRICSLMGPSHAEEVSRRMPTSVVVAGTDGPTIDSVQKVFFRPYFRVYTNPDLVGVELGVALKNCIAIAAGVCDGLGFGDNTKAALVTRGLAEIGRLGVAMGARPETFAGLAGVGDLVVTCLSRHSRNRHVGEKIGQGQSLDRVLSDMIMVAEGVRTTRAAVELGQKFGVELPIIESVHQLLFEDRDPREAIGELMTRPLRQEIPGGSQY